MFLPSNNCCLTEKFRGEKLLRKCCHLLECHFEYIMRYAKSINSTTMLIVFTKQNYIVKILILVNINTCPKNLCLTIEVLDKSGARINMSC